MKTILYFLLCIILISLHCSPNSTEPQEPSIRITGIDDGAVITRGENCDITTEISGNTGTVEKVLYYINDELKAETAGKPYKFEWKTGSITAGNYTIKSVAETQSGDIPSNTVAITLKYEYIRPPAIEGSLETSTMWAEGLNQETIKSIVGRFSGENFGFLKSFLILKNGKLVLEEYFNGAYRETLHHLQSTTKSITSILIGLAIDQGYIGSVNDPMFEYLPNYQNLKTDENKDITIKDLLMMASGLEWNEVSTPILGEENDNIIGNKLNDYVEYVLQKPVVQTPGSEWYYNSGGVMILGEIIKCATGEKASSFAHQYLFGPLDIFDYIWLNQGIHVATHGGLYMRARDLAKIGLLFQNKGIWKNERVVPESWVEESTASQIAIGSVSTYGYLWWAYETNGTRIYYTSGYGGQNLFVIPEYSLIVLTTADYSDADRAGPQQAEIKNLVFNQIVGAILE